MVTTKTKKRSTWTKKEEDALIQAIQKYGVGQWRKILNDAKFGPILIKRNNVQLKDKWRNIEKNSSDYNEYAGIITKKIKKKVHHQNEDEDEDEASFDASIPSQVLFPTVGRKNATEDVPQSREEHGQVKHSITAVRRSKHQRKKKRKQKERPKMIDEHETEHEHEDEDHHHSDTQSRFSTVHDEHDKDDEEMDPLLSFNHHHYTDQVQVQNKEFELEKVEPEIESEPTDGHCCNQDNHNEEGQMMNSYNTENGRDDNNQNNYPTPSLSTSPLRTEEREEEKVEGGGGGKNTSSSYSNLNRISLLSHLTRNLQRDLEIIHQTNKELQCISQNYPQLKTILLNFMQVELSFIERCKDISQMATMANTNNSTATTFNTSTAPTTLQTSMLSCQSQSQSSSQQKYSQMMNHNNLIPSPLREHESYNSYNHSHHPTFLSSSFQSPPASTKNTILSHTPSQQQEEQQTPLIKNTNSSQNTRQHSERFSFNVNNNKNDDKDNRISTEEKEVVRKLVLDQNVGMRKDEKMKNCNDDNDSTEEIQQEMQSHKTQQNHNDGAIINDNVTGQETSNVNLTNNTPKQQQQEEQQKERPLKKRKSLKTPSNNKSPYSERKKRRISIFGSLERTLWSSLYDVSSSLCTPQSSID